MRINYYLPFVTQTGGTIAVFETARRLAERGHDATVSVPKSLLPIEWAPDDQVIGMEHPDEMPDADIVVATTASSAELVWVLPEPKGDKFYFVQGYESLWCGNVDRTYRYPMKKIVVSTWLQTVMRESFSQQSTVVHPGVDLETFKPRNAEGCGTSHDTGSEGGRCETSGDDTRRVLVMDHLTRVIKGTYVAAQAVDLARKSIPNVDLILFGVEPRTAGLGRVAECHRRPTGPDLADLYASCDVFLYPTIADGFGLPPLEAMACGTAVVTTDASGTGDWASPDVCYVAAPHDVEATAEALVRALSDDDERRAIAEAGRARAAEFTWERTVEGLEKVFLGTETGDDHAE